ncbi:hypothetical protein FHL15_004976 [Xylaria flabelliformis]|uniref:Uncharacterized protein n=1 Tax=Xylaria flabelliformis TaxID=2512241 RepID=A0A553I1Y0_9PEZI|nr:hypothetical protein FHL15_004976 [Xylaria flabelliformis]
MSLAKMPKFEVGQAIQALMTRMLADGKEQDLLRLLSEIVAEEERICRRYEQDGKYQTHDQAIFHICTAIWTQIFGDSPPWPTDSLFLRNWHDSYGPDMMDHCVLLFISGFAAHYPTEALQLLKYNDATYVHALIHEKLASLDPSKTLELDILMRFIDACEVSFDTDDIDAADDSDFANDTPNPHFHHTIIRGEDNGTDNRSSVLWIAGAILLSFFVIFIQATN